MLTASEQVDEFVVGTRVFVFHGLMWHGCLMRQPCICPSSIAVCRGSWGNAQWRRTCLTYSISSGILDVGTRSWGTVWLRGDVSISAEHIASVETRVIADTGISAHGTLRYEAISHMHRLLLPKLTCFGDHAFPCVQRSSRLAWRLLPCRLYHSQGIDSPLSTFHECLLRRLCV